jgi:hypothetical protein
VSAWEIGTWLAVTILGPGAVAIFIFFLRDAKRIMREIKEREGKR